MRIMVVDPGFDFSTLPIAESYTRAFERLGYEIVEYDLLRAMKIAKYGFKGLNIRPVFYEVSEIACSPIVNQVVVDSIDIMLMVHGVYMNPSVLMAVRKTGCKTGLILTDDPMQVDLSSQYSKYYDYVFTNDKNTISRHQNCTYLPVAVDETIFKGGYDQRTYNLLVAVSFYKERFEFMMNESVKETLLKHQAALLGCRSHDFDDVELNSLFIGGKISYEQLAIILADSYLALDIPRDEYALNSFGETNKSRVKANCVSPRIFECMATKTLCITDNSREGLFDFIPKEFTVTINRPEELPGVVDYYLEDIDKRKRITDFLYDSILPKNTYYERAKIIERIMGLAPKIKNIYTGSINGRITYKWNDVWKKNFELCKEKEYYLKTRSISIMKDKLGSLEVLNVISNGPTLEEVEGHFNNMNVSIYLNEAIKYWCPRSSYNFACIIHPDDDVYERCFKDISENCIREVTLFASSLSCFKVIKKWIEHNGNVLFFNSASDSEIKKEVIKYTNYPVFSSGYSVAFSAIMIGLYMGFKVINLIGLDFCYPKNYKYRGKKLMMDEISKKELMIFEDKNGQPVLTDEVLLRSRNSVLNLIKEFPDIRFNTFGRNILYDRSLPNLREL